MSPQNSKNRATDVSTQRTIILTLQLYILKMSHFGSSGSYENSLYRATPQND